VTTHVKEPVSHAERKPINEAAENKPAAVFKGIVVKIKSNNRDQTERNQTEIHSARQLNRGYWPGQSDSGLDRRDS
jgi:hypothetical protein